MPTQIRLEAFPPQLRCGAVAKFDQESQVWSRYVDLKSLLDIYDLYQFSQFHFTQIRQGDLG